MYQVIQAIGTDASDKTKIRLQSWSLNEKDILLKKEIDSIVSQKNGLIEAAFPTSDKLGGVTQQMIQEQMYPAGQDVVTMVCGPPKMRRAVTDMLKKLGHDTKTILSFY